LGIPELRIHPAHLLDPEDLDLLELWQASEREGVAVSLGGVTRWPIPGPLPFSGGLAEQPAALVAAFREMSWAAARLRETA
jgi:hypothetical protein